MIQMAIALGVAFVTSGTLRTDSPRIAETVRYMITGSPTFAGMVRRIDGSDLIVYLTAGSCPAPRIRSCLRMIGSAGGHRYLRIFISVEQSRHVVAAQIAHELQHAVEIADAPAVVSPQGLAALYRVIGYQVGLADTFETANATSIQELVARELRAVRAGAHVEK